MKETTEIKGFWYLPNNLDEKIAGILYLNPQHHPRLELIGSFNGSEEHFIIAFVNEDKNVPVIHGDSSNGEAITLFDCYGYGSVNMEADFDLRTFKASFVLAGAHLENIDERIFKKMTVRMPLLTAWVNKYQVHFSVPFKNDRPNGFRLSYEKDTMTGIYVRVNADLGIELSYICSTPTTLYSEELVIRQGYQLYITATKETTMMELWRHAIRFNAFLQLATLSDVDFDSIELFHPEYYQELKDREKVFRPIKMWYHQHDSMTNREKDIQKFLFTYDTIQEEYPALLQKWYSYDSKMAPILKHLAESIRETKIFKTGDFLIVIQALEGFCIRFRPDFIKPVKGERKLLRYLTQLWEEFQFVPFLKAEQIDLVNAVESRDYYSHFYTRKANKPIAEGTDLYYLTQPLKKLLICCVLRETGFADPLIIKIIEKMRI